MTHQRIDGYLFTQMMTAAAQNLKSNVAKVDALNVFPVPDGDTGTNMNLTLTSGVKEMQSKQEAHVGRTAKALAKGLLMGARGNSGVILSQLFRGFAKHVEQLEELDSHQFADALQQGIETAYQAVMKPVEGTILTVAKDAAKEAKLRARYVANMNQLMEEVLEAAKVSLKNTPNLLPVLKQVGVVDSGGQGLVFIYEGMLSTLLGKQLSVNEEAINVDYHDAVDETHHAQVHFNTEDIVYGYCTEIMVELDHSGKFKAFSEALFRQELNEHGDSLLVAADDELVKVHIHTEHPGEIMNLGQQYGDLVKIKVENMRIQHTEILAAEIEEATAHHAELEPAVITDHSSYVIAVAAGKGMEQIFKSLGVDYVLQGGQTMNPSTEDFLKVIEDSHAEYVIILPNNSNIIMAADQAAELAEIPVAVVKSKTIPQGMTAMLSFNGDASLEENQDAMNSALFNVKSGQITTAVRDSNLNDVEIHEGDFISIMEKEIVHSSSTRLEALRALLQAMISEDDEVITLIYGEDVTEDELQEAEKLLEEEYPSFEYEVHAGDQPVYHFIVSVE